MNKFLFHQVLLAAIFVNLGNLFGKPKESRCPLDLLLIIGLAFGVSTSFRAVGALAEIPMEWFLVLVVGWLGFLYWCGRLGRVLWLYLAAEVLDFVLVVM